jgi:hypothetical protein
MSKRLKSALIAGSVIAALGAYGVAVYAADKPDPRIALDRLIEAARSIRPNRPRSAHRRPGHGDRGSRREGYYEVEVRRTTVARSTYTSTATNLLDSSADGSGSADGGATSD